MTNSPGPLEANEAKLLEVLASLNQISASINHIGPQDAGNIGASLQLVVESAIRVVPGSSAVIYTYDGSRGCFEVESRVSAQPDGKPGDLSAEQVYDAPRDDGIGMRAIRRRRTTFLYEEQGLDVHPYHAALGVKTVGCFPLIVADQPVGILYIYLFETREFTKVEQLMLDNFVNQAAMAIYHARRLSGVHRDLARKEDELSRLHRAGLIISSRMRLIETLESILQLALEVTNARYGIFRLLDKNGEFLITTAVGGSHMHKPLIESMPVDGSGLMAFVARTRQTVLVSDLRLEPWNQMYYPLDSNLKMLSELAVPLVNSSGRLEGVLNLESPQVGAFTEDDSHMLQSLATYAVTAIQEVRLLDALQEAAQLLISQPSLKVLDQLCVMANNLLNTSSSAIWLGGVQEKYQIAALNGGVPDMESHEVLKLPLTAGTDAQVLGMFGVEYDSLRGQRNPHSDWDKKVLACLANYAALAVQNESRQQELFRIQEQHWTAETFAAVGDISANLLHNMNNKVGAIPVRVQAIQDKYPGLLESDAYLSSRLTEIERSAMEAMQIVQENLSHLRPIRMEKVNIAARVLEAVRAVQIPPSIKVEVFGLDDLPAVLASGQSLTFVFRNLIENSITVLNGSGSIRIQGTPSAEWVEVIVADSGPGISPDLHHQIFELNFSRAGSHPGKLGFGLWWVKTLMTRLGGAVSVESDGHHGTAFRLRLPRVSP